MKDLSRLEKDISAMELNVKRKVGGKEKKEEFVSSIAGETHPPLGLTCVDSL